jgi:hypothetical protein
MKFYHLVFVFVCLVTAGSARGADDLSTPIYWRNTSPFTLTHGLPRARPAAIIAPAQHQFAVSFEVANSFTRKQTTRLDAQVDGETSLISIDWRLGFGDGYEVGVEIPWLRHHTGHLDTLIDHYHDISGLPEKDRGKFPKNQLNFLWRYDGVTLVSVQNEIRGVGDIRINIGRQLSESADKSLAIRGEIKLPTGEAKDLTGSGAADVSLSLVQSSQSELFSIPLTIHLGGGLLYMGQGDVAPDLQKRAAVFGFTSVAGRPGDKWSVVGQLDLHSALYETDHSLPGSWSLQGGVSIRRSIGDRWMSELVIYEDLRPGSATDFTVAWRVGTRVN